MPPEHTSEKNGRLAVGTGIDRREIAMRLLPEREGNTHPHLVWLGGYRSDMTGTKAVELARHAVDLGTGCVRFDYSGTDLHDFAPGGTDGDFFHATWY